MLINLDLKGFKVMLNIWLSHFTIMLMIYCRCDICSYSDVCIYILVMIFTCDGLLLIDRYWLPSICECLSDCKMSKVRVWLR